MGELEYLFCVALVRLIQKNEVKIFDIGRNADGLTDHDHRVFSIAGKLHIKIFGGEEFTKPVVSLLDNGFHFPIERTIDSKFHSTTIIDSYLILSRFIYVTSKYMGQKKTGN